MLSRKEASVLDRSKERILVLDGAMGTMIMASNPKEEDFRGERFADHTVALKGCNDVLCLTKPELIKDIHRQYLEAGADIISTNTFNANRLSLAEYHLNKEVEEICRAGARIARETVEDYCKEKGINDERPVVAGSMGPTGISLSISMQESGDPAKSFDEMADAYREQAASLIEGGVDLLLLETVFDTLNAKAAVYGIFEAFRQTGKELPVMISATLTESGRLLSGQSLEEFVAALSHARPLSFGLNCGFGAAGLLPYIKQLSAITPSLTSLHPNAGLPDAMGCYLDTPEKMTREVEEVLQEGAVNIIGGCCGTTPANIRALAGLARKYPARRRNKVGIGDIGGIDERGFIKVGERCNVAGSRKFLRLASEKNWRESLDIAAGQLEKGARVLDINMDDAMLDARRCMTEFVIRLTSDPRTASTPLMIDSSDFDVIRTALRIMPLKGIVNSISLKNGEEEFLNRAREINSLGASMVVMAFDEKGQADTFEHRCEICRRAYRLLTEKGGINPEDIIFDPNVLAVATGIPEHDNYALDFIRTTEWIKENLPGAKVSGGISNLSFSFRGIDPLRKAMHALFLEHNIAKGMDMAIINPSTPLTSEWIDKEMAALIDDVLLNRNSGASEALLDYAMKLKKRLDTEKAAKKATVSAITPPKGDEYESQNACQTLSRRLVDGEMDSLDELLSAALSECNGVAMQVVDEALMRGMDRVGEMFGRGEMFLPQVVRSASVMKKAVEIITPVIEQQNTSSDTTGTRPAVVLATVKGDVHDIGKNIVAVVLRCSGFEVVDLGVMVAPEKIIDTAIETKAVAIGLSGLITPSLHEMGVVAAMMEERGMKIPLFVGGATTSDLHTAVKLSPLYSGAVVHTGAAASLPGAIKEFTRENAPVKELKEKQDRLREEYLRKPEKLSLEEARKRATPVDQPAPTPRHLGRHDISIPVSEVLPLINWRAFLHEWNLDPALLDKKSCDCCHPSSHKEKEAQRLLKEAREKLEVMEFDIKGRTVILPAHSEGDDIILEDGLTIPTYRTLTPNPVTGKTLALSDFIYSGGDHLGLFAVTLAGSGMPEEIEAAKETDPYRSLLLQSLSHRLAEAATEWLHRFVRCELWGIPAGSGIRPAVGYPSLPDQSLVFLLDKELDYDSLGIRLTEHGALSPGATTTGLLLAHPSSRYFA